MIEDNTQTVSTSVPRVDDSAKIAGLKLHGNPGLYRVNSRNSSKEKSDTDYQLLSVIKFINSSGIKDRSEFSSSGPINFPSYFRVLFIND